ncbi:uncharacterized protein LOC119388026 [Rhipicephalus sanguineus]|uniref:uncharacterized protein LOC119388026 n=1 Tax=Rhipicephalus sanguineus TaxID=34632 RepID=UPI0020C26560|nr:uncharacterized protein LOC119388026 [Rhipicephalus sanguineus]
MADDNENEDFDDDDGRKYPKIFITSPRSLRLHERQATEVEAYIVDTLKDIGRTLKDQFLVIGSQMQNKTQELKETAGVHAQQIKEQLKVLGEQLKIARDALAKKLFELFVPATYSDSNVNVFQILSSLSSLRERLQKLLTEVQSATGEKWEKLKGLIQELRSEIRLKVQELLHGSSAPAAYTAIDTSADDDYEAYIVDTLKDIGRTLKDQFLVIGSQIQNKTQELKEIAGVHAQEIKEQLNVLAEKLNIARDALAKKLFELFFPATYSDSNANVFQILSSLSGLRERLQKFLTEVQSATGEKWEKLKGLIQELRSEIRLKVQELLHGSSAPAAYTAIDTSADDDYEAYIVDTLKDIGRTLKDQFLVIGSQIQNKTQELKETAGVHAQQIKEQLKVLGEQLKIARDALAKKLFELFVPATYSDSNVNVFQILSSLSSLRERLQKFLTEVQSATGEKWEKLKGLIQELRSEIRLKVQELLHGSSAPAAYTAIDTSADDDYEAYIVDTLKDIRRTLKDQFLVIGNQIQNKTQELKETAGVHAQQIKEQLNVLAEKLNIARDALAKKLFELFFPATYSDSNANVFQILSSLSGLRERLQKFLTEVQSATGEKWEKLKGLIQELRSEIRLKVQELLHGSSAPAAYTAIDTSADDDYEAYIVDTLKDIGRTLKDQFLVIGSQIQNKTQELKETAGVHAQQIKEQLKVLGEQLKIARDALAKKLFELFVPATYSDSNVNVFQILSSLSSLRERLQKFLTEVQSATGEKWEKLKGLIQELRSEIRLKVQELLHGSSAPAAYTAIDTSADDDYEAYIVDTLKDIRRTLKDQFLVIGNQIQNKTQELKETAGVHAQQIKEQLKVLGEQLKIARDALAKKLFELFVPATYSDSNVNVFQILSSLSSLRERLQKFLTEVQSATGEKWEKLKGLIQELRSEIRLKVQELLHGSSAPAAYTAIDTSADDDYEAYIVDTLKDIGRTLKDQFLDIGSQIQNKTQELKETAGVHAQQIKEQLKVLGEQLKIARDALAKKLFELFVPATYSDSNVNVFQILSSLSSLRERLQKFLTEVQSATGEKWEKLKGLIQELRSEIRLKVQELLHGSSAPAAYTAIDTLADDDYEAYIVDTLKDIGRTLKDQFLVIGSQIQKKTQELKETAGVHAQQIKEQLKVLGEQLKIARDALAKKLFKLFVPATYSDSNVNVLQILSSLSSLREMLQKFLTEVQSATGEKWEKLKGLIQELRSEIRLKVQELLHGSSAPAAYTAIDTLADDDYEAYIVDTLKDIGRTLKDQFLVIGSQIQKKTQELKETAGVHAQQIKEQLKVLGEQLKIARDALAKKLFELFVPATYSDSNVNVLQILSSLSSLRERLQKFLTEVQSATGEKWEKLKGLIQELRSEIREKVQELLSMKTNDPARSDNTQGKVRRSSPLAERTLSLATRMFSLRWRLAVLLKELDEGEDKFDDVKTKIERLRKEIRYQVSLYFNRTKTQPALYDVIDDVHEGYLTNALKDVAVTLKEKFLVLGEKIKAKLAELKVAVGEHAVLIQAQLKDLYAQLQRARDDLKRQLFELFRPASYASFEDNAVRIYEKLNVIRQKLLKFLEEVKTITGEKWEHTKEVIAELREEIRQKVRELLVGRTGVVMYAAEDSVPSATVIDTLKETARTLKEKFQTLGRKIHAKVVELRDAVGEHAVLIKQQLESLKSQFNKAHSELMKKLFSLFRPAQYATVKEAPEEERRLSLLKQKLDRLLSRTAASPPEEWSTSEDAIAELRQEIEEFVKKYQ